MALGLCLKYRDFILKLSASMVFGHWQLKHKKSAQMELDLCLKCRDFILKVSASGGFWISAAHAQIECSDGTRFVLETPIFYFEGFYFGRILEISSSSTNRVLRWHSICV